MEDIINICKQYSMISKERFINNIKMTEYIEENNIPGDIIEIGVWKGGSILSMMLASKKYNSKRRFHLYDTFEGMTEPTEFDKDYNGNSANNLLETQPYVRCIGHLDEVKENISRHTDIVPEYHVGDILKNKFVPEKIALLRLDTDWYESTKYELETFYQYVSPGGVVIIDDYGHWDGCKKAVDEFLIGHPEIKLNKIDYTGVYFIKPKQESEKDKTPIIIFTNLFTLKNKDVKQNKYIYMYYIWLYNIIKYGGLKKYDYCITFIDKVTKNYIELNLIFKMLITFIPNFILIDYEQPDTIKEGILKRYDIDLILEKTSKIEYTNPFYIHLDIDIAVIKNIRNLFVINPNDTTCLYLHCEGRLIDSNYYGELITENDSKILKEHNLLNMPGFSAGIYGWSNSKNINRFFNLILEKAKQTDKILYTVEQPFFNASLFHYLFIEKYLFEIKIIDNKFVAQNYLGLHTNDSSVLINFCGVPGDDLFHWDKMLNQLFIQGLTS